MLSFYNEVFFGQKILKTYFDKTLLQCIANKGRRDLRSLSSCEHTLIHISITAIISLISTPLYTGKKWYNWGHKRII